MHWAVWPNAPFELVTPTAYNNGQWHHVAATVGATGMQLFLDGKLVASRTDGIQAQVMTGFWRIGGDRTWSGAPYFSGLIDEVAVYPTVLTADQVARHYAIGTTDLLEGQSFYERSCVSHRRCRLYRDSGLP